MSIISIGNDRACKVRSLVHPGTWLVPMSTSSALRPNDLSVMLPPLHPIFSVAYARQSNIDLILSRVQSARALDW